MKKLLAILLAICCLFTVVSCGKDSGDEPDDTPTTDTVLERFSTMLANSVPTRAEVTATERMEKVELVSTHVLTTGLNQDGKRATYLESKVQTLQDAESGYVSHIKTTTTKEWYIEGMGRYKNNRLVDKEGVDFAPVAGSLALNLDPTLFTYEYDEETDTLTLTVDYENSAAVLGNMLAEDQEFEYDLVVTIVAAGGRISQIDVAYMIEAHDVGDDDEIIVEIGDMDVLISSVYYYNTQSLDIG